MTPLYKIVVGVKVVVPDDPRVAFKADLLIKDDRIAEIGHRGDVLRALYPSAEVIDGSGKIALPGFVDAHYHGDSVLARVLAYTSDPAAAQGTPDIHRRYIRELSRNELAALYRVAYFSALKSGITTIAEFGLDDPPHAYGAIVESLRRCDMRGIVALHSADQIESARTTRHPNLRHAVVLPDEDSLTTYNLQGTLRLAREHQWPILIHHGQHARSEEIVKRNFGKPLLPLLDEYKVFEHRVQVIHCCSLDEGGASLLAKRQFPLVFTPATCVSGQTESPRLDVVRKQGGGFALGSDTSVPDPFENMRALRAIAFAQGLAAPDAATLLRAHTIDAARSLGLHNEIGALHPGMKADIVFLDVTDVRLASLHALQGIAFLEELIRVASSRDVSDVMMNGEFFVRQREIMTLAEEDLRRDTEKLLAKVAVPGTVTEKKGVELRPPSVGGLGQIPLRDEQPSEGELEEGFRIVRPGSRAEGEKNILPLPQQDRPVELSKTVKRVFGDDE